MISPSSQVHDKGRIDARLKASGPVGDLGRPPKYFTKDEKKIWKEIEAAAPAKLGQNDRFAMEITVTLMCKLRSRTIENSQFSHLISCLNKLGMIPVDRPTNEKPKESDPLDRFNG